MNRKIIESVNGKSNNNNNNKEIVNRIVLKDNIDFIHKFDCMCLFLHCLFHNFVCKLRSFRAL